MSDRRTYTWRCQTSGRLHTDNSPSTQECDCQGPITYTALLTPRKKRQYTPQPSEPDEGLEIDLPIHDSAVHLPQATNEDVHSVASLVSADMTDRDHDENVGDDNIDAENMAIVATAQYNTADVANAEENAVVIAHPSNEDVNPARQAIVNTPTDPAQIGLQASVSYNIIMIIFHHRYIPFSLQRGSSDSSVTLARSATPANSQNIMSAESPDQSQHIRRRRDAFVDERPNEQRLQDRITLLHADRANQIQRIQHWKDAYLAKYHEAKRLALLGRLCTTACTFLMLVVVLYVLWCYLDGPEMAYIQRKRAEAFYEI